MTQPTQVGVRSNEDFLAVFNEIADLLEVEDANPFRVRAYRKAARVVGGLTECIPAMLARDVDLAALPGIGKDLAGKLREIAETGSCAMLARLRGEVPDSVAELLKIPGIGPKRARTLQHDLNTVTLDDLKRAAHEHRISELPGFGPLREQHLLDAIEAQLDRNRRFGFKLALHSAEPLLQYLCRNPATEAALAAGSYRRGRDTVGDLDILATSRKSGEVIHHFVSYAEADKVLSAGSKRASLMLKNGMQVDLRVVRPESYGAALVYLTGSKAHNLALRQLAQSQGLKLNEYGVFRGAIRIAGETEESVYGALGMTWIPPDLREDRGEIEAARRGVLPHLVETGDLQGDLHTHTDQSDGVCSLRDMATEAGRRGLHYLAITDHSPRLAMTHGLSAQRLAVQADLIEQINAEGGAPALLKGVEVDILEDGSLDLPDAVLGRLDIVVGAIHSHLDLPGTKQTTRILRALDHPHFSILAHPFGRLLGQRDACKFDAVRVVRALAERGCFVEANSQPDRLDLWDTGCHLASAEGVLVSIASDAHSMADLGNLPLGVSQARRGWLEARDVLNTRSLAALRVLLKRTM